MGNTWADEPLPSDAPNESQSQPAISKPLLSKSKFLSKKEVQFKLHIAIDFGTDGIGLAFAYKDKVTIYSQWQSRKQRKTKTKTQLILNEQNGVLCFGNLAKSTYYSLSSNERKLKKLFEKFKMALYDPNSNLSHSDLKENDEVTVNINPGLKSTNGQSVKAETVFVEAFKHLEETAKEYLPRIIKDDVINDEEIQWILTVPTIWSERAKNQMKKWIIKAGLVDENIKDQCLIVYEPDCASLAIQREYFKKKEEELKKEIQEQSQIISNPTDDFEKSDDSNFNQKWFKTDDKYILIDAGGGTVDIVCHKVLDKGSVEEIMYPTGDIWGSCHIDTLYVKLLEKIFDKQWLDELRDKADTVYADIVEYFQSAKETFYENSEATIHSVQLPFEFLQFLEEKYNTLDSPEKRVKEFSKSIKYFRELFDNDKHNEVDIMNNDEKTEEKMCILRLFTKNENDKYKDNEDYLQMDMEIWKCLFDSKISKIIHHVHNNLLNNDELKGKCNYLCLVGGFSGSAFFQERMKKEFGVESKYGLDLIIPDKPILSVVEGAAYMAITKDYIRARRLKHTYGINMIFGEKYAKEIGISDDYIRRNTTFTGVQDCFEIIARKGDRIAINEVRKNVGWPTSREISLIPILYSYMKEPKIADDGFVFARLRLYHGGLKCKTIREFHFGGTMLEVYAYPESKPNEKQKVIVEYR